MNYKLVLALWFIFAASIIYWDINRHKDDKPISVCHNAEIKVYYDRPMCMECKMFCEVVNEKR